LAISAGFYLAWVKPECLGPPKDFERLYVKPIMDSMIVSYILFILSFIVNLSMLINILAFSVGSYFVKADASRDEVMKGNMLLQDLSAKLSPIVSRAGSDVLLKDLKYLQQAVIHVRQSKAQIKLYRAFRKYQKEIGNNNFFFAFQKLFLANNHPGCLVSRKESSLENTCKSKRSEKLNESDDTDMDLDTDEDDFPWWAEVLSKNPKLGDIGNGAKILLVLHILAHAEIIGELA